MLFYTSRNIPPRNWGFEVCQDNTLYIDGDPKHVLAAITCIWYSLKKMTHGKMHSFVTAFNSTDIRSVQNVATPVTAMMVTVCISTDAVSSVFISPDLSDTNSFHQCCWFIMPVTACSYRLQQSVPNIPVSFCYIRLIQH